MVIDGSESADAAQFQSIRVFADQLAQELLATGTDTRLSLAEYSSTYTQVLSGFTSEISEYQTAIANMEQSELLTFTGMALESAVSFMTFNARERSIQTIVIVTDSNPARDDSAQFSAAAHDLQRSDIQSFVVGVGSSVDESVLRRISQETILEQTPERILTVADFNDLEGVSPNVSSAILSICDEGNAELSVYHT